MKRVLIKIFLLLACALPSAAQTSEPACAPAKESDWKRDELQGRVRSIRTYKTWFNEDKVSGRVVEGKRDLEEEASYDAEGNRTAWRNVNMLPLEPNDGPDVVYVCDAANRLAEVKLVGRDGALLQRDVHVYDAKGFEIEMSEFLADGRLERREKYSVDSKGNPLEIVSTQWVHPEHFTPKRSDVYVTTRQTNRYDERGNVIEEKHFYPDGSLYTTYASSYDSAGRRVKVARTDKQGRLEELTVYAYRGGRVAVELNYINFCYNGDESMCKGSLTTEAGVFYYGTKTVYAYDARGNWVSQVEYEIKERAGKKSFEPSTGTYREITYY